MNKTMDTAGLTSEKCVFFVCESFNFQAGYSTCEVFGGADATPSCLCCCAVEFAVLTMEDSKLRYRVLEKEEVDSLLKECDVMEEGEKE